VRRGLKATKNNNIGGCVCKKRLRR
jgi:hypothetical protein